MLITGLDIASTSGVSFVEPSRPSSTWHCLAIEAEGDGAWAKIDDFDCALRPLLADRRPDLAVIERPLGVVVDYGGGDQPGGDRRMINATTTITLAALAGAAIGILNSLSIPWVMIADKTWRTAYYGKGYKPAVNWKVSAVEVAERQGIALPSTKKAAHDAAEAVGIAVAWRSANFIPVRHQKAFMDLRLGNGRAVA